MLGDFGAARAFGKITVLRQDLDAHIAIQGSAHGAVSTATVNAIVRRDSSGRALMVDPPASDDTGLIATTKWVNANTGVGTVTSIVEGVGMDFSVTPLTGVGTINLANTAVAANTYAFATITVDAQGRLTNASAGSPVLGVTASGPVVSSGGQNPILSMVPATASVPGHMTTAFASKLNGIAPSADVNIITSVFGRTTAAITADANDYTIQKIAGVTIDDGAPSGGSNGDVWFEY